MGFFPDVGDGDCIVNEKSAWPMRGLRTTGRDGKSCVWGHLCGRKRMERLAVGRVRAPVERMLRLFLERGVSHPIATARNTGVRPPVILRMQ